MPLSSKTESSPSDFGHIFGSVLICRFESVNRHFSFEKKIVLLIIAIFISSFVHVDELVQINDHDEFARYRIHSVSYLG